MKKIVLIKDREVVLRTSLDKLEKINSEAPMFVYVDGMVFLVDAVSVVEEVEEVKERE